MKKKILYITLFKLFIIFNCYGQSSKIEYYTYTKNTVDTTGIRSYLLFNKDKSLFVWKSIIQETESSVNISEVEDNRIDLKKVYKDTIGTRVLNIYADDKLVLNEPFLNENYVVIDKKSLLDWKIENELKDFKGLKTQKATTFFRGRYYIAWFCSDIPLPSGPWKLNGLPGLIIEAYDLNREVNFLFKSFTSNIEFFEEIDISVENAITINEFVSEKDNLHQKMIKSTLAKLPRGSTLKSTYNYKRKGIELTFEWEKNTKKD